MRPPHITRCRHSDRPSNRSVIEKFTSGTSNSEGVGIVTDLRRHIIRTLRKYKLDHNYTDVKWF